MKKNTTLKVADASYNDSDANRQAPIWHWFGEISASVEPSRPIRHAGSALVFAIAAALGVEAATLYATHAACGWSTSISELWRDANGSIIWTLSKISVGNIDARDGADYAEQAGAWRCIAGAASAAMSCAAGGLSFFCAARAQVQNVRHVSGPRLLEGREALADARRYCIKRKKGDKTAWPLFALPLCAAERLWLPKQNYWSRSALFYGSPGSGKTQVISPIVSALVRWQKAKALVWDAKGDYTSAFFGRRGVAVLSPCDDRSAVWDIARDCRTAADAQTIAGVLASGGGTTGKEAQGDFFQQAATTVLAAALETMQAQHGDAWGWDTFAKVFSVDRASILKTLIDAGHSEVDELIGTQDAKSASVMATVGNAIAITRTLARAWPFDPDRAPAHRFSVREWLRDDYNIKNRARVLMIKPDELPDVVGRMLAAMTNIVANASLQLKDNEGGRCIAIVCDEIAALKSKIDIAALVATGRSKGIVAILGLQDIHQLVPIYGPDTTKALASMVGLHIVGKTNMGETRQEISDFIGERIVSVRRHGPDAGPAAEEAHAVVMAPYITHELGPFGRVVEKDKHGRTLTRAKGVRMLVHGVGPNVLRLEWPIVPLPRRARGYVPAAWTTQPIVSSPSAAGAEQKAGSAGERLDGQTLQAPENGLAAEGQKIEDSGAILPPAPKSGDIDMGWAS